MQPKIEAFRRAVLRDPAVESVAGFIGGGRGHQQRPDLRAPQAARGAQGVWRRSSRSGSGGRCRRCPAARLWLNVDQDIRFGGGFGGGSYQYTLRSDDLSELRLWAQRVRDALKPLPELTGIEDELVSSQQITLEVDREAARQLGHRDVHRHPGAQQRVRAAPGVDHLQRDEPVPRGDGGGAAVRAGARGARPGARRHDRRQPGAALGLQPLHAHVRRRPHQPQRPVRVRANVSFELAPGVSLSQAEAAINRAVVAAHAADQHPGTRCRATRACSSGCRATSRSPSSARCSSSTSCSACSTRATCTR